MTKLSQLEALHDCYRTLTNRHPRYLTFERDWYAFLEAGYTLDDLKVTLEFIQRENKKHDWKYSLALGKLIGDLGRFDDLCEEAKAKGRSRVKPKSNQQRVMEAFRGHKEPEKTGLPQSVKDVLKGMIR